jgi:hypothetical protein
MRQINFGQCDTVGLGQHATRGWPEEGRATGRSAQFFSMEELAEGDVG